MDSRDKLCDFTRPTLLAAIEDGGILGGKVGETRLIVWRKGQVLRAYGATCPHLGGPLDQGLVTNGSVRCPWHHACFDLATGEATAAPAFDALDVYIVKIDGDHFVVDAAPIDIPAKRVRTEAQQKAILIIGGGAAAFAAANSLRRAKWGGEITLFSEESAEPYDRTLLTKDYLDGHFSDDRLPIARHTLADIGVGFEGETSVEAIDTQSRLLCLTGGRTRSYGKLLLATGAEPRKLSVPGADQPHVLLLRSLADCRRILSRLNAKPRIAIVGGSFIALETAASLRSRGLPVDVISPEERPMEKILGRALSDLIVATHRDKGVGLHLGAKVTRIAPDAVALDTGESIAADLVLVGIGVEPRIELAARAGLKINRGVVVDERLQTSADDIFAIGDIARWPDPHSGGRIRVEHWVVAERQGEVAAANMLGADRAFDMVPFFWTKHFDLSIRYVGHAEKWDEIAIDGDVARRDAIVRFRSGGRDLAIATVGRDKDSLAAELAMEKRLRETEQPIDRGAA